MDLFIRFLIVSFPFVFVGTLFWPAIEGRFISPVSTIEESTPDDYLALPERSEISSPHPVQKQEVEQEMITYESVSDSGIYRWVDENGNIVFSDRPTNKNAVEHTPIDIGYVEVSEELKQNVLRNEVQLKTIQSGLASGSNKVKTYQVASQAKVAGYEFSRTSAGQKHGYVLLTGRISSGQACKKLVVSASARSDMGESVSSRDETSYNGFGSTLFEMKPQSRWSGSGRRPFWEITNVYARCVSQ